jgi:hypothetical protein
MLRLRAACIIAGLCFLVPHAAFAQGVLTGVVKDPSGAVLPGVAVEVTSPDLIERARTAVTDSGGQYRIVDLRAGTYTVVFALQGFNTLRREGISIQGTFTATVNVELRVGTLAEAVTVTGETPIVDTQSVKRQTVIDSELIAAVPAARSYAGLMTLMPGTVTQGGAASDTQVVPGMVVFGGAGGRSNEGRLQLDGLSVGSAFNGAGVSAYVADVGNAQEVVLTASGGLGETEVGGPTLNIVPKTGGNTFNGSAYASGVSERMVDSNYTQELKDRKLTTPGKYQKVWDLNLGVGGPILRDRLWFFGQIRDEGSYRTIPGMFANANMGDPTKWTYVADTTRPAVAAASFRTIALRLTSQVSKNKFSVFWDEQKPCEGASLTADAAACRHSNANEIIAGGASPTPTASATAAPETAAYRDYGQRVQQARWTNPLTSKLLLEAAAGTYQSRWGGKEMPGANTDLVRVTEQCLTGQTAPDTPCAHGIQNLVYRAPNWASNKQMSVNWNASASYVLGAHNAKLGYQGSYLSDNRTNYSSGDFVSYRFNNGVPNQITQSVNRFDIKQRVETHSLYAQESWTLRRFTLLGALRYDRASSFFPAQTVGPVRFLPIEVTFPRTNGVDAYQDLTPRGGVAWDVFGDGKTSLKFNVGKYLEAAQNGGQFAALNPTSRLSTTATRIWNDRTFLAGDPRRDNLVPDCDLLNPALNGECGLSSVTNFGTLNPEQNLDPALLSGWGNRSYDWQTGVALQRQVLSRVSVEVGYQRRWLGNFVITDNRARNPEDGDFTVFGVNVPADTRLPDAGGYVLDGLYNVTQAAAARSTDNLVTLSKNYGNQSQVSHAFNLNATARSAFGLVVQGGLNYSRTNTDRCDIRAQVPEYSVPLSTTTTPTNPWCSFSQHLLRGTALASYTIPRIDIQVAGAFRSDQGDELAANWTFGQADTVGLDRALAGGSTTAVVNLIEPGTLYGDRVNQFDFRLAKILRFGGKRTNLGLDVYNVFNANPVLTYSPSFVPNEAVNTWLRPNSVLTPRFAKISVQFDF